jgi:hypothetical protein
MRWLRQQGRTVRFTTKPTRPRRRWKAHLGRLGFETSEGELVTPVAVGPRRLASSPGLDVLGSGRVGEGGS